MFNKLPMKMRVICVSDEDIMHADPRAQFAKRRKDVVYNYGEDCIFPAVTSNRIASPDNKTFTYNNTSITLTHGNAPCFFSHIELWKSCVEDKCPYLILEDDAVLGDYDTIEAAIRRFTSIEGILYLQSQIPYRYPMELKYYPPDVLTERGDFFRVCNHWDMSGTAAYVVTPATAQLLLGLVVKNSHPAIDGFITNEMNAKLIQVYIPKDYYKCFMLSPEYWYGDH